MSRKKSTTSARQIEKQWAQFEARAAKLGLSTEEFLTQRLIDLEEKHPERYDELMTTLASSALHVVRLSRQVSAKLPLIEAEIQAVPNNTKALDAVRDLRRIMADTIDQCGPVALLGDGGESLPS